MQKNWNTWEYIIGFNHYRIQYAAAAAKSLQSCLTLCDPRDGSPPGSPVPGILQARTLEWVAISFSNALKWKVKVKSLSRAQLPATPWTAAHQAPPSMGFSRQEYWSGVPLPSPRIQYGNALKIMFLYNPAIPLLSIFPKELKAKAQRYICIPMLMAALFIISRKWKQPVSIHGWMDKQNVICISKGVFFSAY